MTEMDQNNNVLNTVLGTDVPDSAKRKILDALDITAPDNGFRLIIDFQYEFDMPEHLRATVAQSFDYWLKQRIRDYKIDAAKTPHNNFLNQSVMKIASTEILDIIYCQQWEDDWAADE
jgi:hypothetical protein